MSSNVLACNRVTPQRMMAPLRGALQLTCVKCGAAVWVSPASLATIAEHGPDFIILCLQCTPMGELKLMPPSTAQLHEIERELEARKR